MSFRGYKPKWKKANWTLAFPEQVSPAKTQVRRVRRVGKAMARRLAVYAVMKASFLAERRSCARCGEVRALDVHHSRGRSGEMLVDTRHWVVLCRPCHDWVHAHPDLARKAGLLARPGDWGRK